MPRSSPIFQSFNGGEFSPHMDGRVDQEKYYTGCKTLENFIPIIPGPAVRRGGTRFVAPVKDETQRTWLSTFSFNREQSYVLEWGNLYIRFFVNRGQLLDGAVPFEVVTVFNTAALISQDGTFALQTAQSQDVLFVVHSAGDRLPRQLRRMGATDWTFVNYNNREGPFLDLDADQTIEVTASAETGTITLTASADLFVADHVSLLFYMEPEDLAGETAWFSGNTVATGDINRNAGNIYEALSPGGGTGPSPPVHERGIGNDGAVDWRFLHSNYGIARITAVNSPTSADAMVLVGKRLPRLVTTGNPTTWWAFEAWSAIEGFPTSVALYKERLLFSKVRTLYGSRVGNLFNHNRKIGPDFTPDAAFVLQMAVEGVDEIRWMLPLHNALAVGTAGSEVVVAAATSNEAFSAQNATAVEQTNYGALRLPALRIGNVALFVQRGATKIREYRFALEEEQYLAPDLTVLADHITQAGIVDYAFASEPYSVLWVVLDDGQLLGLTHNRDRGVVGWHRHPMSGFVESCAVIPNPNGKADDLWLIIRRTVMGQTRRYVEVMEQPLGESQPKDDAFYVDSGTTFEITGAPQTVFAGLEHLEGLTVQILADGAVLPAQVVSGGSVTVGTPVERVAHIGLPYTSRLQPMRMEAGAADGTAQGRMKRIHKVIVRLVRTLGGLAGKDFETLAEILYRTHPMEMDESPDLFTGDKELTVDGGWDRDGYICIEQRDPLPMTVSAIMPHAVTND